MKGSAPNDPATGSQVDVTRKRQPKLRIAGHDFHASEIARAAARAMTLQTAHLTAQSKMRSPDRLLEMPRARDASVSDPAPGITLARIIHERYGGAADGSCHRGA